MSRRHRPAPARTPEPVAEVDRLRTQLAQERDTADLLAESVADLERALVDPGWVRLTALAEQEFSPQGLVQLRAICRIYALKNPLIKRGLALRQAYVWGQGVEVSARANGRGHDGEQDVNALVQTWLTDSGTTRAFTGADARGRLEWALGTDGEVFIALFTRPSTGWVTPRTIQPDEIHEVICDPEDADEPWYYRRRWTEIGYDTSGQRTVTTRERMYPAVDYRPAVRPATWAGVDVAWDCPVLHVAVNRPLRWQRGVPDAYAAIDWARAFKEFLEDWARLMRSLSRYAWKATAPGSKAAAVRAQVTADPTRDRYTHEPNVAGATLTLPPDVALEAVSKNGATIDAESGRPLAMMVAAALGVPVTMLLADPGLSGARATAETLDQPTELEMQQRRELWSGVYRRVLAYLVTEQTRATRGALRGMVGPDQMTGRETVTLAGDTTIDIDVAWPALKDLDPLGVVDAVVAANGTGTVPPDQVLRLLLTALGVRNVDSIVDDMIGEDGEFLWPAGAPLAPSPGADALAAHVDGQDPAATGPGSMSPDGEDPPAG